MEQVQPYDRPTLTIKLRPYLQDYIRFIMNAESQFPEGDLLCATKNSYLGKLIFPFLERMPPRAKPNFQFDRYQKNQDGYNFTFALPYFDNFEVRRNTAWISLKNQQAIQQIVEAHFRLHFRFYADDKVRYRRDQHTAKGSIQAVVNEFCSQMNIRRDGITFDMISKAYYRARKKSERHGIDARNRKMIGHLFFII